MHNTIYSTSCEELTHWKRLWCWEGLGAGGEGDDGGWDGWMASRIWWMWVWVNSGRWWWTGRPGVLWFMGSQRVGHDWATELNWIEDQTSPTFPLICTEKPKICVTSFIVIFDSLWSSGNQNHNISEVCLYTKEHEATRSMGMVPTYVQLKS